jgi:hypothetical protein
MEETGHFARNFKYLAIGHVYTLQKDSHDATKDHLDACPACLGPPQVDLLAACPRRGPDMIVSLARELQMHRADEPDRNSRWVPIANLLRLFAPTTWQPWHRLKAPRPFWRGGRFSL